MKYDKLDRIKIDKESLMVIFEWGDAVEAHLRRDTVAPINEGLISYEEEGTVTSLYFRREEGIGYFLRLAEHAAKGTLPEAEWVIKRDAWTVLFDIESLMRYRKPGIPESTFRSGMNFVVKYNTKLFLYVMAYIMEAQQDPAIVKPRKESGELKKKPKGGKSGSGKPRTITFVRTVYDVAAKPLEHTRQYHRQAEAWGVCGHTRRYKSGKEVYIQPYQKGKGERSPKNYKI